MLTTSHCDVNSVDELAALTRNLVSQTLIPMNVIKWFPFVEKVGRFLENIPNMVFTLLGSALLVGTVLCAAMVTEKNLAVAVATSGSIAGTALLSLYLPKLIYAAKERELKDQLSSSEARERLRETQSLREKAEKRCLEAEREIARLESMRINVEAFQPIIKLGLMEVETSVKDYQYQVLGDETPETWYRKGYRDVYMGVVEIPLKAQLGIDLQKVRVWTGQDNRLMVAGITMTTTTDTAEGAEWKLYEVRREFIKDEKCVSFEGEAHDTRTTQHSQEQEQQVRNRLKQGQDFKHFEVGLIRAAQQVLRVMLAPLGKEISFPSSAVPESQELFPFLADHNKRLTDKISDLDKERNIDPMPRLHC
jgi:hypothetical protein